jgi:hypothetical protein
MTLITPIARTSTRPPGRPPSRRALSAAKIPVVWEENAMVPSAVPVQRVEGDANPGARTARPRNRAGAPAKK